MKESLRKDTKQDFDERQLLERGKAFRNAFYTALFDVLILYALNEFAGLKFIDPEFICYFLIWTSVAVFLHTAIWYDAFEAPNDTGEGRMVVIIWGVCGAFLLLSTVLRTAAYLGLPKEERDIGNLLNTVVTALCMLSIFITYALKRRRRQRYEEE